MPRRSTTCPFTWVFTPVLVLPTAAGLIVEIRRKIQCVPPHPNWSGYQGQSPGFLQDRRDSGGRKTRAWSCRRTPPRRFEVHAAPGSGVHPCRSKVDPPHALVRRTGHHRPHSHRRRRKTRRWHSSMPILRALHLRKALADDRDRIARDMHDDLGTLLTLLTINSAPVGRDMEENPETAFQTGSSGLRKSIDHAPSAPSPAPAPRW